MAKNKYDKETVQKKQFNYGSHRKKYSQEFFQLIDEISSLSSDKKAEKINNYFVLKVYTILKNFGLYQDIDAYDTVNYFQNNEPVFYQKLKEYLSDINNKAKVFRSLFVIKKQILNIRDYSNNGFYEDFLEDLKAEIGLIVKTPYNNFIEPSIYKQSYETFDIKKAVNKFAEYLEPDYCSETMHNKAAGKRLLKAYKEAYRREVSNG